MDKLTAINLVPPLAVGFFVLILLVGLVGLQSRSEKEAAPTTQPWGRLDFLIPLTFAIGFFCVALWRLDFPAKAVFDECYHSRSGMQYLLGQNPMEWTHPPLAKLIIAEGLQLFGGSFDPREGVYSPGAAFSKEAATGWRFASVVFGALSLALQFWLARLLTGNRTAAVLATAFLALDGVFFVQSRVAMTNIFTVCFILAATLTAWLYRQSGKPLWLLGLGVALGLAVATRWTTLYALGLIGLWLLWSDVPRVLKHPRVLALIAVGLSVVMAAILQLMRFYRATNLAQPQRLAELGWLVLVGGLLYLLVYVLLQIKSPHERLLALPGWYLLAFVVLPVTLYLVSYRPYMLQHHDFVKVFTEQREMWNYHSNLKEGHPYSSPWWSWPLVLRPTWYEYSAVGPGDDRIVGIWCIGNVFVWWAAVPALAVGLWRSWQEKLPGLGLAVLMGLGLWLAWGAQPRPLVFLHYFFEALPFACIALGYFAARLWRTAPPDYKALMAIYGALIVLWFVFFYPLLSALPVPRTFFQIHLWQRNDLWV